MSEVQDLSVADALAAVLDGVSVLPPENVPLLEALGRVSPGPVIARDSLPPFANSSMDGYALRSVDSAGADKEHPVALRVIGDIAAGTVPSIEVTPGTAARIMTGAPMPAGADAVIPVEDTNEPWRNAERPLPSQIEIYRHVGSRAYVRPKGEDIQAGQVVMEPGHVIRPQEIGMLASLGVAEVSVIRRPRVGILSTGDELLPVEEPLRPGKIRNSNGYAQAAQVMAMKAIPVNLGIAIDTEEDVRRKLNKGLEAGVDLFVSSAGVSVGAYDVVKSVLENDGEVNFWRVRMRPGKPLAYGTYGGIPYLGLPGNPVSAMVSFERFARAAILKMAGHAKLERPQVLVTMHDEIHSDGRESYVRAVVSRHEDTSLVKANALVIVPEGVTSVELGEKLCAWMIDWPETIF
jgi:molybdopterin molybdotransferase